MKLNVHCTHGSKSIVNIIPKWYDIGPLFYVPFLQFKASSKSSTFKRQCFPFALVVARYMRFIHIGAVHSIPQCLLEIFAVRFLIICLLNTLSLFPSLRWMCRTSVASKIFMVLIACSRIQRRHQTLSRIPKTISTYHPWHSTIIFCKTTLSFHLHNVSSDTYILM